MKFRLVIAAALCLGTMAGARAANVTTNFSTSVVGNLACMDAITGTVIKDCGIAPLTTFPALSILANPTGTAAAPTTVVPTGTWTGGGVPVLNKGTPVFPDTPSFTGAPTFSGTPSFAGNPVFSGAPSFTGIPVLSGGRVYFQNIGAPTLPSVIELDNLTPIAGVTANTIQSAWKNSSGTNSTRGIIAQESTTLTTGAETGKWKIINTTGGSSKYEFWVANGIAIENSSNPTTYGVGTLNVKSGYYCSGVQGVTCGVGTMNISTMTTNCGLVTHC